MLQGPRDLPEVLKEFEEKALACTDNLALLFKLGRLYLRNGNPEDARRAYQKILSQDPENVAARVEAALCEAHLHQYDEAIFHLEEALARQPQSSGVLIAFSRVYEQKGDVENHLAFLRRAANSAAKHPEIRLQLAEKLRRYGDFSGAIREYRTLLELNPDLETARFGLATLLMKQEQFWEAIEHLQTLLQHHPSAHDAQFNLGQCYFRLKRYELAATVLVAAQRGLRNNPILRFLLAQTWAQLGDFDRSLVLLEKLVEENEDNQGYQKALGEAFIRAGEFDSARAIFEILARANPEKPDYTIRWAQVLHQQKHFPEVLPILQSLFARHPGHIEGHRIFGETLLAMGRLKEAREEFAKTLMVSESYLPGLQGMVNVSRAMIDPEAEYKALQKLLIFDPGNVSVVFRLGQLERQLKLPTSLDRFRKVTEMSPLSDMGRESAYYLRHSKG